MQNLQLCKLRILAVPAQVSSQTLTEVNVTLTFGLVQSGLKITHFSTLTSYQYSGVINIVLFLPNSTQAFILLQRESSPQPRKQKNI